MLENENLELFWVESNPNSFFAHCNLPYAFKEQYCAVDVVAIQHTEKSCFPFFTKQSKIDDFQNCGNYLVTTSSLLLLLSSNTRNTIHSFLAKSDIACLDSNLKWKLLLKSRLTFFELSKSWWAGWIIIAIILQHNAFVKALYNRGFVFWVLMMWHHSGRTP